MEKSLIPIKKLRRKGRVLAKLGWGIMSARLLRQRRPVFIGLYIMNRCNLRCPYCFVNIDGRFDDSSRRGFSADEVFRIVDELYAMGTRWIFLLGGEPLMHEGIGPIVRHIVNKGILLHVLTNGTLIEQRINEIEPADAVCISIDGLEASTDIMRGRGTFRRALRGAEVALSRGMAVRIHAVLGKPSLGDMEMLAEKAGKMGINISISPPNYLGTPDNPALQLTKEEYRDFYRRYRKLKKRGFPINNSFFSIDKALHWPIGYHEFITPEHRFSGYKPIPCIIGNLHGCIDAEGIMFNCIQMGCLEGLNIKKVGIKRAWDELPNRRPNCVSCASINTIETAAYLSLHPKIIFDGFRFFFDKKKQNAS